MQTYDLTVHMDEDGDPILEAQSDAGRRYIHDIAGDVENLMLVVDAESFMLQLPRGLTLGVVSTDGMMIQKLCSPPLH